MTFDQLKDEILVAESSFDQFVEAIRDSDKKVFLFGAGLCGRIYLEIFSRKGVALEGIIDNYKISLDGHPVYRLETILSKYTIEECVIVISAPASEDSIRSQLSSVFPQESVFSFAITRYILGEENEPKATKQFFLGNCNILANIYRELGDDFSRDVFSNVFIGRVTGNKDVFAQIRSDHFYHPPEIIQFSSEEVLVELGSNDGQTLLDFIHCCPTFKNAYCFEADQVCLDKLYQISRTYPGRIHIIPKIAWDCKCVLSFCNKNGDGTSSVNKDQIAPENMIEAGCVDDEVVERATFIKMDIEGAELKALRGAEHQIKQFKPKLAVSVYHRRDDLVEIPQYLRSIRPDYRFYLRHHGYDDSDTVLYAI